MIVGKIVVIGAGPAGLTAAYLLSKHGIKTVVLEADPLHVGGISRTVEKNGFGFDIGGHRFFSKSKEVNELWREILPQDFLERERSSRIYFRKKFFRYPLKAGEALWKLGLTESLLCLLSYLKARLFKKRDPKSFEDWVTNEFGRRLFEHFFKSYTEKVWGMKCRDISADWAAQRIRGLSLWAALRDALFGNEGRIKTLTQRFFYPRRGPGMMWEECARKVRNMGGEIFMGARCVGLHWDGAAWIVDYETVTGERRRLRAEHVISSAPLNEVIPSIEPRLSEKCLAAAKSLRYRDFITVALIMKGPAPFSDQWIYVHEPDVYVGRIQNFKSWSPDLVPDPEYNCFGLEYFCNRGDGLWMLSDDQLVDLAVSEFEAIGLAKGLNFVRAHVVRQPKAYPVYDEDYAEHVNTIRTEMAKKYPTFHFVGRNGMHKYNNQDHAMMTAMLTVENILSQKRLFDVWRVNQDAEYHETGERLVPSPLTDKAPSPAP